MIKENGVTLVSLVVTIIILIILAGVSINAILGENGIITIAKQAKENIQQAQIAEQIKLNELYMQISDEDNNIGESEQGSQAVGNATEEQVLEGVTFSNSKATGLTGSMPNNGGIKTSIEIGKTYTIPKGYHNGEGTITTILEDESLNSGQGSDMATTVQVGDFVNYSVGQWTQEDINKLGDLYETGGALPSSDMKFGGFKVGDSKDQSINIGDLSNVYSGGWRVFRIEGGLVQLIHAGTPEAFYYTGGNYNAYISVYLLSGRRSAFNTKDKSEGLSTRDWTMYENLMYAKPNTATCVRQYEICSLTGSTAATNNDLRTIGVPYWVPDTYGAYAQSMRSFNSNGALDGGNSECFGIRPIVTLKSGIRVISNSGDETHTTPETAWNLIR